MFKIIGNKLEEMLLKYPAKVNWHITKDFPINHEFYTNPEKYNHLSLPIMEIDKVGELEFIWYKNVSLPSDNFRGIEYVGALLLIPFEMIELREEEIISIRVENNSLDEPLSFSLITMKDVIGYINSYFNSINYPILIPWED